MITLWATVAVLLVSSGVPGHSRYQVINMMDVIFHLPMSRAYGICQCCLDYQSSRRIDQAECPFSLADLSEVALLF